MSMPQPARAILALEDHALLERAVAHYIDTASVRDACERDKFARLHQRLSPRNQPDRPRQF
jgi:hypothetical protein